ncbi:MAG: hypothetical protein ABJA79_02085 [Parafilimonas sp.]
MSLINYIPLFTTLFSAYFFLLLFRHWVKNRKSLHVFWWMIGVLCYGAGTLTESINTVIGYSSVNFKAWYILGALLGGVPLAQGTVYLLMKRKTANILSLIVSLVILITTILVILSPLNTPPAGYVKLNGSLLRWQFIRYFAPFINTYAFIFLVGGAIYSAFLYSKKAQYRSRFFGNVLIATGGLLPGIGGTYTTMGHVEVLYVTEFIGILAIYAGYHIIKNAPSPSLHVSETAG